MLLLDFDFSQFYDVVCIPSSCADIFSVHCVPLKYFNGNMWLNQEAIAFNEHLKLQRKRGIF